LWVEGITEVMMGAVPQLAVEVA